MTVYVPEAVKSCDTIRPEAFPSPPKTHVYTAPDIVSAVNWTVDPEQTVDVILASRAGVAVGLGVGAAVGFGVGAAVGFGVGLGVGLGVAAASRVGPGALTTGVGSGVGAGVSTSSEADGSWIGVACVWAAALARGVTLARTTAKCLPVGGPPGPLGQTRIPTRPRAASPM